MTKRTLRNRANHYGAITPTSITGVTAAGEAMMTAANAAAQTALLGAFTSGAKGLAPASGGGTTNFLRADGTWTAPGGIADGDKGDITVSGSGATWTIDNGVVTLAKQADMATASVVYRKTAGSGAPEVQTLATLKADLGLTGTNSGDQTITLTGDVTGSGTGSFAATIGTGKVTLAKMADMATSSLIYRKTAGTGAPEVNTLATLKADLGLTGTNSGDQTITLTGDVTGSGTGSFAATIAAGSVTLAKQADVATARIMGRVTAGTGSQEALTGTQATTLLDTFTTSLKGLAPASGGGTTNFLRADGTWAAPPGGSGTNLSYTASTRVLASDTGTDATLPLVSSSDAGLAPASGGGTTNYLRADGTWTAPPTGSLTFIYGRLGSTYTLTSTGSAQKLFNWSTNGAASITAGIWEFDCMFAVTSLTSTSGNAAFSLAGTATLSGISMAAKGIDNNTPTASGTLTGSYAVAATSNASIVTAGTGTGMWAHVRGVFTCTGAGTLIPSITLVTAAAGVVAAGSYFKAVQLTTGTSTPVGTWT